MQVCSRYHLGRASSLSKLHTEYPFTKYDIQNPVYTYSQDEYSRFLDTSNRSATPKDGKGEFEKPWTKEWTDYLFKLYNEYDGRWHVIWDRAEFPPELGYDLEVRTRFCHCCLRLLTVTFLGP